MMQDNLEESDKYDYEKIEKYINSELSDSEQAVFEQRLQTDHELKKEVDLYKELTNNLAYKFKYKQEDNEFKATIEDLGSQYFLKKNAEANVSSESEVGTLTGYKERSETENPIVENSKPAITKRLFLLGTFIAAASLLLLFNPFSSSPSYAQLAEQNFEPYDLQTVMNSVNNGGIIDSGSETNDPTKSKESKEFLKKGKVYYNKKDYESAIKYFDQYLAINPNNIKVLLAKGSAQLELNQNDGAIQTFKRIEDDKNAQWYLALAFLKNSEVEKAIPLLQNLSNNSVYGVKANDLLNRINETNN